MSGSRTKSGCFTCRVRKKKCDEQRPICRSCSSRGIYCYGYNLRPPWMLGKGSWQEVLDCEEARAIRTSAGNNYNLRRRNHTLGQQHSSGIRFVSCTTSLSGAEVVRLNQVNGSNFGSSNFVPVHSSASLARSPQSKDLTNASAYVESIWWDSCMPRPHGASSTTDLRNLMSFLDVIIPMEYGFYSQYTRPDNSWLLQALFESEPLYHASIGLSVCFESGKQDGNTSGFCDASPDVRKLQIKAIQGLKPYVSEMVSKGPCDEKILKTSIHTLSIIIQLLSLEIFLNLGGAWETHLQAARAVLGMIQKKWLSSPQGGEDLEAIGDGVRNILVGSLPTTWRKTLEFYTTSFVWADILAEATHGPRVYKDTDFEYLPLLREGMISLKSIMGCQDIIMIAISRTTVLEARKDRQLEEEGLSVSQLCTEASSIESDIRRCIQELSMKSGNQPTAFDKESTMVTMIYAYAALLYVQTVACVSSSDKENIGQNVAHCLERLEALPSRLFIRVCWPFTITGCLAEDGLHDRFRVLVTQTMVDNQLLGFTWKGFMVMEECWRLRRREGGYWYWRNTMERMKLRILFI